MTQLLAQKTTVTRALRTCVVLTATAILAALTCAPTAAQEPGKVTIEDIRKAWQARQDKVKTARIEYNVRETITKGVIEKQLRETAARIKSSGEEYANLSSGWQLPFKDSTFDAPSRLLLEGVKAIWSTETSELSIYTGKYEHGPQTILYDGKSETRLLTDSPNGLRDTPSGPLAYGQVLPASKAQFLRTPPLLPLLMMFRPFVSDIRFLNLDNFKVTGRTDVISGARCVELSRSPEGTPGTRFWVDPARDYVILRVFTVGGNKHVQKTDINYRPESVAGWVPQGWVSVYHQGKTELQEKWEGVVSRCEIGGAINSSELDLTFPPNTKVVDELRNQEYYIKPNGAKRPVPREDKGATYEQVMNSAPGEAHGRSRSSAWLLWAVVGSGCSAVGFGLWWFARTRRTTSPRGEVPAPHNI